MTMPQLDQMSACPRCEEPVEEGDRFCGACGTDLHAARAAAAAFDGTPPPSGGPVNGARPRQDGAAPASGPEAPASPSPAASPGGAGQQGRGADPAAPQEDFPLAPAAAPVPQQAPATGAAGAAGTAGTAGTADTAGTAGTAGAPSGPPRDPRREPQAAPRDPRTVHDEPAAPHPEHSDGTVEESVSAPLSGPEPLWPRCVACGTGAIDDDGYCEHCGHKQPRERDHMETALETVAAASDRGLRHHRNEDFYAVAEARTGEGAPVTIAVVCDGVSSATRPDEASAVAARAARDALALAVPRGSGPQDAMHEALVAASEAVDELAADTPPDPARNAPACTIVGALAGEGMLTVGWVGDSRAYWVPHDRTEQPSRLTEDDSWAAQMVAAGLMNEAEAYADARAHAITGWLGADSYELDPHTATFAPHGPGVVVVCTDGLWNYAESAQDMAAAVPEAALSRPLMAAQHLVGYALDGGGHDNVTVAVVPFPGPAAAPQQTDGAAGAARVDGAAGADGTGGAEHAG